VIRRTATVLLVTVGLAGGCVANAAASTGGVGVAPASTGPSGGAGLTPSVKPKPKPKHNAKAEPSHVVKKPKVKARPKVATRPRPATTKPTTTASAVSGAAVLAYARRFTGTPYVYGGNGPSTFDCSGFTSYVFAHFGYRLDRTSYDQMTQGTAVHGSLQVGDLVFWDDGGHVGIYAGNDSFISATVHRGIWTYSFEVWKQTQSYTTARRIIGEPGLTGAGGVTSASAARATPRNGGPADATP
jgi:cell wall-associated NlpC family hydrolase